MKKTILKKSILIATCLPLIITMSCATPKNKKQDFFANLNNNNWDKLVSIQFKKSWTDVDMNIFSLNLKNEFNKLKNKDQYLKKFSDVDFESKAITSDDVILVQDIISKKNDLIFSSISSINESEKNMIAPKIQTLTNSFKFDTEWSYYSSGTGDDKLIKVAKNQNVLFNEVAHKDLLNTTAHWTGSIYKKFYDLTKKVDFYRGSIWISGSDSDIVKIEDAWVNKNWNKFKSFGIVHGEPTSGGRFILQEKLLKKHFGKEAFTTLSEEILTTPIKFKKAKAKDLKLQRDFKIAFDYEGSFAWIKNEARLENGSLIKKDYYSAQNMKILTATEPFKYDIGSFRQDFDIKQANLITQAFINLTTNSKDIYGPTFGYNGYKKIKDTYEEVYKPYKKVSIS